MDGSTETDYTADEVPLFVNFISVSFLIFFSFFDIISFSILLIY